MSRVMLLVSCVIASGCDPGAPGLTEGGSTGGSAGASSTVASAGPSTTTGPADTSGVPGTSGGPESSSGLETSTGLETASGLESSSGTTSGQGTDGTNTTTSGSTTTGSDSTSGEGSSSAGEPDPVVPINTLADVEWVTPFSGRQSGSAVRLWNGSPILVLNTPADVDLVVGGGLPSEVTVQTSASSIVALAVFDGATGAVTSTQVLFESSTPEMVAPFTSTILTGVEIDEAGALNIVGGWTGVTTFFPGTPDATTRNTVAVSFLDPDGYLFINERFDGVALRVEPDGSAGWLAVSAPPPGTAYSAPYNYPRGVVLLPNGDPLVLGLQPTEGTTFPAGFPGAYVSEGQSSSAFVRLDRMTGEPSWIGTADTYSPGLVAAGDGAVYMSLPPGVYFDDTPDSVTFPVGRDHITRFDPDGGVQWAVSQSHQNNGWVDSFAALGENGIAAAGVSMGGTVTLEGADGVEATTAISDVYPAAQWFSRVNPEGSVVVLRPLPESLRVGRQPAYYFSQSASTTLVDDEGVWYGGFVQDLAWFDDDDIPELSQLTDVPTALIHVNHDGFVDETRVLGEGFELQSMAWADDTQTRLVVSAWYRYGAVQGLLAPGESELQPLPFDAAVDGPSSRVGFVASIHLDP